MSAAGLGWSLKTARGTLFDVLVDTNHYVLCSAPKGNADTASEVVLDFEDLAQRGYFVVSVMNHPVGRVIFEKRGVQ